MTILTTQLEQLENAQLVRRLPEEEELAYQFKHALTQESAYESLLLKKRREIHRLIAEAFERLYSDRLDEFAALLGQHYAEAGEYVKTFDYEMRSGDVSARLGADAEARVHYATALEALARLPDRDDHRYRRVDALTKQVSVSWGPDSPEQNLARLAQAEVLIKQLPDRSDNSLRLAQIYYWRGRSLFYRNDYREAVRALRHVMTLEEQLGDPIPLASASSFLGVISTAMGQFRQAQPLLEQSIAALEQTGRWGEWLRAACWQGIARAARGEYGLGVSEATSALDRMIAMMNQPGIEVGHILLAHVHLMGGDVVQMLEESHLALELAEQLGDWVVAYHAYAFRGWAASRMGDDRRARVDLAQAKQMSEKLGGPVGVADWINSAEAEMAYNAGDFERALALAQKAADYAHRVGGIFAAGLAQRVWGQALAQVEPSRWPEAEARFVQSLRLFEEGDARLEAARTNVAWGGGLKRSGSMDAAREHFEQAAGQFQASGLTGELERTKQLIASLLV